LQFKNVGIKKASKAKWSYVKICRSSPVDQAVNGLVSQTKNRWSVTYIKRCKKDMNRSQIEKTTAKQSGKNETRYHQVMQELY
jgi:hypothetical protein